MPREPSELARGLLSYIEHSPTPYHAVAETVRKLEQAGFTQLQEGDSWELEAGSACYVCRGGSSLVAFRVGARPPHETGFALIGAHTDSPNLRLKPLPEVRRQGVRQLGVEVYGGVLLSTWLDRDLSLAGRVMLEREAGKVQAHLLDLRVPMLRIPNLAIHLNRTVNSEGLVLNAQQHMVPVLGLDRKDAPDLRTLLATALSSDGVPCSADAILSWDLSLYDTQPPAFLGDGEDLIASARLDNLASCYGALQALTKAPAPHDQTRAIALYDHEEVGSRSTQGADSTFLKQTLERICQRPDSPADAFARALAHSFLISADMAHAVHPNYADRHEPQHRPLLGKGPVVKINVSQAYATDGESQARFEHLCRDAGVTPQHFVSRSDLACGSTIGPITSSWLGLRTVDVGSPLLSMHSIREVCAATDVDLLQRVLDRYFA